jgi:2-keto-4-pentenoate hydratase/2-oxohepta-3-ene-1,7-dioic acid hydratase in catechol pathway
MRLCTVSTKDIAPFFGIELKNKILRVAEAARAFDVAPASVEKLASTMAYFQSLPASEKILRALLKEISSTPKKLAHPAADGQPILIDQSAVTYHPPIERPGKFLCIGMNYRDHCAEKNQEIPKKPVVFNKFATSLIGHGADIPLPLKSDKNVDYEAELGVVIGKRARRVTKKTAMKCVGGYLIVNDVSLRSIQKSEPQWSRAKGFDGSGPCGPAIVTADEVPDPHNLRISCALNGKVVQNSNTSNLVFNVADLISFISQLVTLEPGDIISTGTPGGVGAYSNPPRFLTPGDVVEVRIDRLGALRNGCVKG